MDDEGKIDPLVTEWLAANPDRAQPFEVLDPELLELARGDFTIGTPRDVDEVVDELVDGVPVRIYRHDGAPPTGLVVYFHGGGWAIGSLGLMDNVARAITLGSGAVVVSVGYRLAPENPYPAGLDDCEAVTRWAHANAGASGWHRSRSWWPARAPAATWPRPSRSDSATPATCRSPARP